jgi:hypothetical protein
MNTQHQKRVRDSALIILLIVSAAACFALRESMTAFLAVSLCWIALAVSAFGWLLPLALIIAVVWLLASKVNRNAKTRLTDQLVKNALDGIPSTLQIPGVQLVDIGILAYDGGKRPKVSRSEAIPAYVKQLRPFVIMNFTETHPAQSNIKFELIDAHGQIRFTDSQPSEFQRGKNFLTPQNWLRMGDGNFEGKWSLQVSIDDRPLALHEFTIAPREGAKFRPYLQSDGEIDEWLSKATAKASVEPMSLDELIGESPATGPLKEHR